MKLYLTIDGREQQIDLAAETFDVAIPSPGIYSILLDGRSWEAAVEESSTGLIVSIDGRRFEVTVRDPRRYTRKAAGPGGGGAQSIVSPMPGRVVRVLSAVGESVEAGQGIVVVEAMKMQNELKSPRAGRVVALSAKEGDTVGAGQVLAAVE